MPKTWGLSKEEAGYKPAPKLEVRCDVCAFMFPRMAIGSCKYVRGAIKRGVHLQRVRSSHRREVIGATGAGAGIRTPDLRLTMALLYP